MKMFEYDASGGSYRELCNKGQETKTIYTISEQQVDKDYGQVVL